MRLLVFVTLGAFVAADEASHQYAMGEDVTAWVTKVGPYHNPQETYTYYTLPFCQPNKQLQPRSKWAGLAEILDGAEFRNSDLHIPFATPVPSTEFCSVTLDEKDSEFFAYTVSNHYWYQMYIDDLPLWGMVGEVVAPEETIRLIEEHTEHPHDIADSTFLYTHKRFSIAYNQDRVIEVNLTSEAPAEIVPGATFSFTYSVDWVPTIKSFDSRFDRYLDFSFFEHQIHWFSIFNSFMMVLFLCGLVALILMRTLKQDFAKYMKDDDEFDMDRSMGEDSGWKQVHGEVFRRPPFLTLFSALIGTGYQLALIVLCVILAAIMGSFYKDSGATATAFIAIYALTSVVAGYTSGAYYRTHFYPEPSPGWIRTMIVTAALLPGTVFTVMLGLNCVSLYYGTINSIPFSIMVAMLLIWVFVSLLVVAGTIIGRRWSGKVSFPCRVNSIPRPIPPRAWYQSPWAVCLGGGILPFGSIFIEMYFIFTSFWNYKVYYVYGFMALVYAILVIVTSCVTIVAVYFFLNSEDYRWPWLSFLSAGSTAFYVAVYSLYFYVFKTNMTGFLQMVFYSSYMMLFCLALAVLCGTIGFFASSMFVHRIYRNIKVD